MSTGIVHHPFVVPLGPLTVTGFGLAVVLAFAIAHVIMTHELARRGHDAAVVLDLVLAVLAGTLVGAKVYYVLVITHDWHDLFTRGGFVFWGGFLGAVAATAWVIRRKRLAFLQVANVAGIAIAAGYAVGRTGCWAVGDDYGRPWASRWAVQFPEGAPPSTVANMVQLFHVRVLPGTPAEAVMSVYPTQLAETALGLVMFLVLWRLRDHRHAAGWLFGVYCVLAGVERFLVEIVRAKDDRFFGGVVSTAQVAAIAVGLVGLCLVAACWRPGLGVRSIYGSARPVVPSPDGGVQHEPA